MPKHNKKTLRRSRKKGRKNEKKTRKNYKKGGSLFGLGSKKKKINKFKNTIYPKPLARMKKLIGTDNAEIATKIENYPVFDTFEKLAEKMNVKNIRITEYKYRNNLRKKDWKYKKYEGDDTDAHYGMFKKDIDNEDLKKRIIAMFAVILKHESIILDLISNDDRKILVSLSSSLILEYNRIKEALNENNDETLYWMVEYEPDLENIPRQLKPGEKITKENIFMFQFKNYGLGLIKESPGFKFSILKEEQTAFSKEESERPDNFKSVQFNTLYSHPTAQIEEVKL